MRNLMNKPSRFENKHEISWSFDGHVTCGLQAFSPYTTDRFFESPFVKNRG